LFIQEEEFEKKEESLYFSPEKCNVAFASSLDCWGFSMRTFANIYSKKLGFNANKLVNLLWGKFYYNASTKKVTTKPINSSQKTMFSSFILKPLIDEYKKVSNSGFEKDSQKYRLILEKVKGKLSKWLPIAKTIFKVIIDHLPSPLEAQKARIKVLCPKLFKSKLTPDLQVLKRAVENCDNSELAPVVIYISKMMPINSMQIPDLRDQYLQQIRANPDSVASDSQSLIGFGRIFSGRIRKGGKYFVIGVKHGKDGFSDIHTVGIKHLYLFMGANLIPMQSIPAGNIVAIGDLQNILYKTGTISSNELCPSFLPLNLKVIYKTTHINSHLQFSKLQLKARNLLK
jgi:ribosome assembly protein 1